MKNMKNRFSDPDPDLDPLLPNMDPRIPIHFFPNVDPDPDPRQNEMDPKRRIKGQPSPASDAGS